MTTKTVKMMCAVVLALILVGPLAQAQKAVYLEEITKAADRGWKNIPRMIENWKRSSQSFILWGYNPEANPVYAASVLGFLYEQTGDRTHAERAASLLIQFADLRSVLPADYAKSRIEYERGVPPLANFFHLPPYMRAYLRIRNSGVLSETQRERIEKDIAESADFVFTFPEWGAHNRAMLRAEGLLYASQAMASHPHAARWRQMAEAIAADNLNHWEVEDATGYHSVWLHPVLRYAEAAGREDVTRSVFMRYYMEYFPRLMGPRGLIPEFGDAYWNSSIESLRFVAILERGAAVFALPEAKWAARTLFTVGKGKRDTLSLSEAHFLIDAFLWADEKVSATPPTSSSQEVLDDLVGKKVVFRNGWEPVSTYMLLNYRDEGDGGWLSREYLRQTISVEEEKMHHGHADENSIALLMHGGSVLLHDGGYRDSLPSGQFGAWRQDYFHNRLVVRKNKRDPHQGVLEFVRNSGAYRAVRTQKIDFVTLTDVDMSRTRVLDQNLGYQWDRSIIYVKKPGVFLVIDAIKALQTDYFTFTTFWHGQQVLARGEHRYEIAVDTLPGVHLPRDYSLDVRFLETYAKTEGDEPISRTFLPQRAVYQTQSSQYKAGDTEIFVTALIPHKRGTSPASLPRVQLVPTSAPYHAVAVEVEHEADKILLCVKTDLEREVARENIRPRYLYDLGAVRYGEFETDAHFFVARMRPDSVSVTAVNVLKVLFRGKELMAALSNTHPLQLDGTSIRTGYSKWRRWEGAVRN